MKMQKRIAVVIMLCMLGCTFPALAEGMESGALMESRNTAQSTADRINDLERFFANELQGIKLTRYGDEVSRNGYAVPLVNRLVELEYFPDDKLPNGRKTDTYALTMAQYAAADFFAQVMEVPNTIKEIEPLTYVLLQSSLAKACPVPMFSPKLYQAVNTRYLSAGEGAYATMSILTEAVENGMYIYTGISEEGNWQCAVYASAEETSPQMLINDRVFVFGTVEEIDSQAKTVTISAELVAFKNK